MGLDKPNGQQHPRHPLDPSQRIPEGFFDARDYFAHLHFDIMSLHAVMTWLMGALLVERVLYYGYYLIRWIAS